MRLSNAFESFRPSVVTVTAFEQVWELESVSAYEWIGAVAFDSEQLSGVFPGLCPDADVEALLELSFREDFTRRCANAARTALGRAAGKDWWWAHNLIDHIISGWPILNGIMLREGVNSKHCDLPDYLDSVYSLLYERGDEEGRMKLDIMLRTLPKGVAIRQTAQDYKQMGQAFAAD